jgi:hypothetical protein
MTRRLLREASRLQEDRFTRLDTRIREQHLEVLLVFHAVLEDQRLLVDGHCTLSADLHALIARLDPLIRGPGDGNSAA